MLAAVGKRKSYRHPRYSWRPLGYHKTCRKQLDRWKLDGRNVSLLPIGGPEGLAPACKAACRTKLVFISINYATSASSTCSGSRKPYRAWSITTNHPYHRE